MIQRDAEAEQARILNMSTIVNSNMNNRHIHYRNLNVSMNMYSSIYGNGHHYG